jgi:hypothetical protein
MGADRETIRAQHGALSGFNKRVDGSVGGTPLGLLATAGELAQANARRPS